MENWQVGQSVGPDGERIEVSVSVDEAVSSLIVKDSFETVGLGALDGDQCLCVEPVPGPAADVQR
eukprot:2476710-Rhodomonas_salina.1